ncbi:MAG: hypothetical protein OXO52_01610 [Rhodospirillales bacterium]|nr:hypothetical protein [Rhodospirillales bacterium]MDE0381644.1 hypothetical protein [Rhodospirillales bacterium]
MKLAFLVVFFLVAMMTFPALAGADCYYDGQRVPEGTRIGALVCVNGQWEYRP